MDFQFLPTAEARAFTTKNLIGMKLLVRVSDINNPRRPGELYVGVGINERSSGTGVEIFMNDWVKFPDGVVLKVNDEIEMEVTAAWLQERCNGGRANNHKYQSYAEYFNQDRASIVQKYWKQDVFSRRGEVDKLDLTLQLSAKEQGQQCCIEMCDEVAELHAPEEWYSELYAPFVDLQKGFYRSADEAITAFSQMADDDEIFGERYFPILAFPLDHGDVDQTIFYYTKGHSKPIVIDGVVMFGTRCKPYDYQKVITKTYEVGGKVVIGQIWDWE